MKDDEWKKFISGITMVITVLKVVVQHRGQCAKKKSNKKA